MAISNITQPQTADRDLELRTLSRTRLDGIPGPLVHNLEARAVQLFYASVACAACLLVIACNGAIYIPLHSPNGGGYLY
jgi:hypothetical protein